MLLESNLLYDYIAIEEYKQPLDRFSNIYVGYIVVCARPMLTSL